MDRPDFLAQRHADLGVECRQRLIKEEHARLRCQRARQRHALLLAAGHLEGEAFAESRQPDEVQHLLDPGPAFLGRHARHPEAEADVVLDVHVGEKRIGLEHHADLALIGRQRRNVLVLDHDVPGGRSLEAGDHPEDRRLAAPGRTEQRDELASAEAEVRPFHDGVAAERFDQVFNAQEFFGHGDQLRAAVRGARWASNWIIPIATQVMTKEITASAAGSKARLAPTFCM